MDNWLRFCCEKWLALKDNDVVLTEKLTKLKLAAKDKGFQSIDVSNMIHAIQMEKKNDSK